MAFTYWPLREVARILDQYYSNSYRGIVIFKKFWDCPELNATRLHWWLTNTYSGNGLVPSGNKPLPDPVLTQICVIWHHRSTMCSIEMFLDIVWPSHRAVPTNSRNHRDELAVLRIWIHVYVHMMCFLFFYIKMMTRTVFLYKNDDTNCFFDYAFFDTETKEY